jgi:hypothetical protein
MELESYFARSMATCRPIPLEAPITKATLLVVILSELGVRMICSMILVTFSAVVVHPIGTLKRTSQYKSLLFNRKTPEKT